jgi:hypothetical protein
MFQLRLMDSKSIPLFYLLRQGWARSLHEDGYQFGKPRRAGSPDSSRIAVVTRRLP